MPRQTLRIAIAQINCTVGDLEGNSRKIIQYAAKAKAQGARIVSFPELAICGYPPEDLLLKPKFIADNLVRLKAIVRAISDIIAIVGFVDRKAKQVYNAAGVIHNGKLYGVYRKAHLPNYGVFDEQRYFEAGEESRVFRVKNFLFGVTICEDIWHTDGLISHQAKRGAKLILNINASPYHVGKIKEREEIIRKQARQNRVFISYVNLVGGQDELVFDGQSMVVDDKGRVIARAEAFKEDLLIVDLTIGAKTSILPKAPKVLEPVEEVYQALLLGLQDYVSKNRFKKVVIGLSGGIDSALVATLAADALGKDNVICVFMPSRYSSEESAVDAKQLADNLGIKLLNISIEEIYKTFLSTLEPQFRGLEANIAEENLQARIRGNTLMALSNKFGWLVLTTGNKSEMSTGYATLYGDMAGGFAVIKDVPKTLVYKLARYRNSLGKKGDASIFEERIIAKNRSVPFFSFFSIIPERILTKEPSAELKDNQKDSDTLPPYETLDPILKAYVEEDKDLAKISASGFDKQAVEWVLNMVDKSEYKRRQSPPGIKITPKAFGRDRRMPITNKYKG